jgi:hypothetical protein
MQLYRKRIASGADRLASPLLILADRPPHSGPGPGDLTHRAERDGGTGLRRVILRNQAPYGWGQRDRVSAAT